VIESNDQLTAPWIERWICDSSKKLYITNHGKTCAFWFMCGYGRRHPPKATSHTVNCPPETHLNRRREQWRWICGPESSAEGEHETLWKIILLNWMCNNHLDHVVNYLMYTITFSYRPPPNIDYFWTAVTFSVTSFWKANRSFFLTSRQY
jgi:hypothetical protein